MTQSTKTTTSSGNLKSLSQGIELLKLIALKGAMRNNQLAKELELSRPTITRIVKTLEHQGVIKKDPESELISLDMGAAIIGLAHNKQSKIVQAAHPVMVKFKSETGISIALTAIDRMTGKGVYLTGIEDESLMNYPGDFGSLYSLMDVAAGRSYLRGLTTLERNKILKTQRSQYNDEEWKLLLQKMEDDYDFYTNNGYGKSLGELDPTLNFLFIRVAASEHSIYSLCCLAMRSQMTEESIDNIFAPALKIAASEMERKI